MPKPSNLLQGTLDLLILHTVASKPTHGWGIAQRIETLSGGVLTMRQGTLYPALCRLETRGWIHADWATTNFGRPARFWSLTGEGRRQLENETRSWHRLSGAVNRLLK
jgi:transcriptional regulator